MTITLHPGMTPQQFNEANGYYLIQFVCSATGHVPATRIGTHRTMCLCGSWVKPVIEDGDDGIVSQVTVDALRAEIEVKNRRMTDLYLALERAIEELNELGSPGLATDLTEILQGRTPA